MKNNSVCAVGTIAAGMTVAGVAGYFGFKAMMNLMDSRKFRAKVRRMRRKVDRMKDGMISPVCDMKKMTHKIHNRVANVVSHECGHLL